MRWQLRSLRARFVLIVLLAVMPEFVVIIHGALLRRDQALAHSQGLTHRLAHRVVVEQERLVGDARGLLITIAELPEIRPGASRARCAATLRALQRAYPQYASLGVATLDGRIFCSSKPLPHPVRINDRSYFRRALAIGGLGIGDYQRGRVTGVYSLNFGYPVRSSTGRMVAVAYAALDQKWLARLLAGVDLPQGSVLSVIDSQGTVLADDPAHRGFVGHSIAGTPMGQAFARRLHAPSPLVPGLDGVRRLYAFASMPLPAAARGSLYVSAGVPEQPLAVAARAELRRGLTLIVAVAALALTITWIGSDRLVVRRMRVIADVVRRLAAGERGARTGLAGPDELGAMAQGVDDMAAALARTHRALATLGAGNRALVHARTEHALLSEICRVMVEVGGYRLAWIGYVQDEDMLVRPLAQWGFKRGMQALRQVMGDVSWGDDARGQGVVGSAIRTGRPQTARHILTDPRLAPWRVLAEAQGYASAVGLPLMVEGRVIGALGIYSGEPDAFSAQELELLTEAALDVAFGIAALRTRIAHDRAYAELEDLARYDALTGLPNHAHLESELRAALAATDPHCALLVIDLNNLRDINDALGFASGDLLIKEAAGRLRHCLQGTAFAARMRGGEFAIMLREPGPGHDGMLAQQVARALQTPFAVSGLNLEMSVTIGISRAPEHGRDVTTLLRHSDVAMRHARMRGETYLVYEPGHDQGSAQRLALAGELRRAIEQGELVLYYQPKVKMPQRTPCGVEALVRWNHPARGFLLPDEFIALAERTSLIRPLSEWVVGEALRQSAAWRARGVILPIAVNISTRNLEDAALVDKIQRLIAARSAQAGWIEIEVTEGAVMRDPEAALAKLQALRDMGIMLYIDDFGTGYSSLSYLTKLPMAAVKIDKSFVLAMLQDHDAGAIVRSTISLAHDLGLTVVAEGIETEACWNRLCALGCDVAQGYHISRPLTAAALEQWLGLRAAPGPS